MKFDPAQPRILRHRSHYKIYILGLMILSGLLFTFWVIRFSSSGVKSVMETYQLELLMSLMFYLVSSGLYFFWLRSKLNKSIQVFPDRLVIQSGRVKEEIHYLEIMGVTTVCWSIFYVNMKNGTKYYFSSSFERVDYIWEGIYRARPELINQPEYDDFRVKLVQYDHHQKRKEWFFKHKMVDVLNWAVLPVTFLALTFIIQSKSVIIHQEGIYFFRLFMYVMLILFITSFIYSIVLKKFVFDKRVSNQLSNDDMKMRDLEFEGMILQRSKFFQLLTACFVLMILVRTDLNLFSVTKIKEDIATFKLKKGNTIVVDNRYNCVACKYQLLDGDYVIFGRGTIGQVLAREGDIVGQVSQDPRGRTIASENIQEVPKGHLAIRAGNGKDIFFVKMEELIGKIQN